MKSKFRFGKKTLALFLAFALIVTGNTIASVIADETEKNAPLLGLSGEKLGDSGEELDKSPNLGRSSPPVTLGFSLFSGGSGLLIYDGVDVANQGDFVVDASTSFANDPKTLSISAKFDTNPILGNNPDEIKNRKVIIDINPGMILDKAPGLKGSGFNWEEDLTGLDETLAVLIQGVKFTRNPNKIGAVYQFNGGQIEYTIRDGVKSVVLPIFVKGELATLTGGPETAGSLTMKPLDILTPVEVKTQATKSTDLGTIVPIDNARIDKVTIIKPIYLAMWHNAAAPALMAAGGEGTSSVVNIAGNSLLSNYNIAVKNVEVVYSVPEKLDIINVTAKPVSTLGRLDGFSFTYDATNKKLRLKYDAAYSYLSFEITSKAHADVLPGTYLNLQLLPAETTYDTVFSTSNNMVATQYFFGLVTKDYTNLLEMNEMSQNYGLPKAGAGMLPLGGFTGKNQLAKAVTDQIVKYSFNDTGLDVRMVRLYSEKGATGQSEFKNIKITSTDNQVYPDAGDGPLDISQALPTLEFDASKIFTGVDVGIKEVVYEMPIVNSGTRINISGDNAHMLYSEMGYFGYFRIGEGESAVAEVTVTSKENPALTATNRTTSKIIKRQTAYLDANGSVVGEQKPGGTVTAAMAWSFRNSPNTSSGTTYYVDDFTFYFREVPNMVLAKDSIRVRMNNVEIDPTTYTFTDLTDNTGKPVYAVKVPSAFLKIEVAKQVSGVGLSASADYKINAAVPSFSVNMYDYIMAISGGDKNLSAEDSVLFSIPGNHMRPNIYGVNESTMNTINNTMSFTPLNITVGAAASFSASTGAQLDDGGWKTYKHSDTNIATNGTIVLNPEGKAEYKLQILNESKKDVTNFTAYVPIPKAGGDLGNGLNAKGVGYDPKTHMQADDFGWTVNLKKEPVYTPSPSGSVNTFKYEYSTKYATDDATASAAGVVWTNAVGVTDWTKVQTVRITSPTVPNGSFDTFVFDIGFDDSLAEAQAGNTNIYSARFIGNIEGNAVWTISDPVAILLKTGTLSGRFWTDKNRNGSFDVGEGIANKAITAYRTGGTTVKEGETQTDINGLYKFVDLDAAQDVDVIFTNPSTPANLRFETPATTDNHLTAKAIGITPSDAAEAENVDSKMMEPLTVTFIGNGETTTPASPASQTVKRFAGETVKDPATGLLPTATRTGYTLIGWATISTGKTPITGDEIVSANTTYYAIWSKDEFTVTFDGNLGTTPSPATIDVTAGKSIAESSGSSNLPTSSRTGYVLAGWAELSSSTIPTFTADKSITANITVYAVWRPIVSFSLNGVTGTAPDSISTEKDKSIADNTGIYPDTLPTLNIAGYRLVGWASDPTDTTATFPVSTNVSAPKTVYAVWKSIITLDANGGTAITPSTIEVNKGSSVGASGSPNTLPNPTRTGYIFDGWNTADNATVSNFNDATAVTAPVTIYAIWKPIVTFNPTAGGTIIGSNTLAVTKDTTIENNPSLTMPTAQYSGKTHTGWKTAAGDVFDKNTVVSVPIEVFAVFETNVKKVTFNSNGGPTANPDVIFVDEGFAIKDNDGTSRPNTLPTPVRGGYILAGWATRSNITVPDFDENNVVSSDITVHAVWRPVVSFSLNGVAGTDPANISTEMGKSIADNTGTHSNTLPIPDMTGYAFVGWANAPDSTTATFLVSENISAPKTVHAVWKITVTLDANKAGSSVTPTTISVFNKKSIADNDGTSSNPNLLPVPVAVAGYEFAGWANGQADTKPNAFVTDKLTASKTIYAVWRPEVSFNLNGVSATISTSKISVESGKSIGNNPAPNNTLPVPVAPVGHKFVGWANNSSDKTANFLVSTDVSAPKVVYAVWTQVVTLDVNGGDALPKNTIEVTPNTNIGSNTAPNNALPNATRNGYEFGGWSTLKTAITSDFNETTTITAPITIYAIWKPIVNFDSNGGNAIANNKIVLDKGKSIADYPTVTMPVATRDTYKFLGWATSAGAKVADFTAATVVNETLTVYAVWEEVVYKITVEHNIYNYNENVGNAVLHSSEVLDAREGSSFAATTMVNEDYNFVASESASLTINPVIGNATIKLYYKHVTYDVKIPGNTVDGEGKVVLDVHDKYPFKNNSVTFEEFLKIAGIKVGSDKVTKTKSALRLKNYTVESDDFKNLDYITFTAGYDQMVNLTFTWDNGQVIDHEVKVQMVDRVVPKITVTDDQRFYFDKTDKVPKDGNMNELIDILKGKGLAVTDNYDKEPSFTLNFVDNGSGKINWKKDGEHAFYVNAVDTSGNKSEQRAIIVVFVSYRDDLKNPDGTSVPDSDSNGKPKVTGEDLPGSEPSTIKKPLLADYITQLEGTQLGSLPATGAAAGASLIPLCGILIAGLVIMKKKKEKEDEEQDK